jgi:enoyl-CoA hydratase
MNSFKPPNLDQE